MARPRSRIGAGVAFGAVIAAVGLAALVAIGDTAVDEAFDLNALFHVRGPRPPPAEVVVAAIDPAALPRPGLRNERPQVSRATHAELVRRLTAAHAAVVAFDVQFDAEAADPGDGELASAIGAAGNVLLAETLVRQTIVVAGTDGRPGGQVLIDTSVPPAAALRDAARGHAAFPLPRTSRIDTWWAFLSRSDSRPSLPMLAFFEFAAPAYDDLRAHWNEAATAAAAPLLPERATLVRSGPEDAIAQLRELMLAHTDITHAVDVSLAHSASAGGQAHMAHALFDALSGNSVRYLNYYGAARSVTTLSYSELLGGADGASWSARVAGKVVFVGYSGASSDDQDRIRDDYPTVYASDGAVRVSGVEIAATAFANLLEDNHLRPLDPAPLVALLAGWGLLLGMVARAARPAVALPAILALGGAYVALAATFFATRAVVMPVFLPIIVQLPIALLGGALLHYRAVRREREAIKETFGYFLPRHVVDDLAQGIGPLAAASKLVRGACVSTDVADYSALAETMPPAELGALMDRYFGALFAPVKARGGIVLNVVGDAMLAIWTSPGSDAAFRRNACHAALDVAASVDRFNAALAGRALRTRIAVHSGELMLGSFGAAEHYEYRAVGDIVNTATRIDGLNKYLGARVLVSAETVDGLGEFLTRPLGDFLLAGKSHPTAVCELVGLASAVTNAERRLAQDFAAALGAYRAGRFGDAVARFSAILLDFPTDGPAKVYRDRCAALAEGTPTGWDPVIRMDNK